MRRLVKHIELLFSMSSKDFEDSRQEIIFILKTHLMKVQCTIIWSFLCVFLEMKLMDCLLMSSLWCMAVYCYDKQDGCE